MSMMENGEVNNVSGEWGREDIVLHPEAVKQRQDVYSSLTDLYGVDVFSTEFQDIVERVVGERKQREEQISGQVFVEDMLRQRDADTQILGQLFLGQKQNILTPDYESGSDVWSFMHTGVVLIAILAVSALYIFIFQDRKVRRK
ncbi:MAG: hypothetical protein HDR17_02335 [Lachnospiraceae bacterium]|nr:hypothetical protein [Lachnospiraceae bacterium]